MPATSDNHIINIAHALSAWFSSKNKDLGNAIEQSVDEKLFTLEDIKHQILALKYALNEESLKQWVHRSQTSDISSDKKTVLCLHAGNLPLVGIQDLIAVLLRNGNYKGKLSRKDPYLIQALLHHLADHDLVEPGHWSVTLEGLRREVSDALLFAGSKQSAGPVKVKLKELGLIDSRTPALMRTAGYSIAYIDDQSPQTMRDLTEALFRYGGAGCRSAAVVVSPFPLAKVQCEFTDYIESFWLANPPRHDVQDSLKHRFAANKAVGIQQAWLEHFLIEESDEIAPEKHLAFWIQGDLNTVKQLAEEAGEDLQSIYSTASYSGQKAGKKVIEPLSLAQRPPIWWKPDDVDTLVWLKKHGI